MDLKFVFDHYNMSFIQDLMTVLKGLNEFNPNISVNEIILFGNADAKEKKLSMYEMNKEREQARREFKHNAKRCPACGNLMVLNSVNDAPGNQVGGDFKSTWSCVDVMGCGETVYSEKTIHDEAELFGLGKLFPDKTGQPPPPNRRRQHMMARRKITPEVKKPCGGCR